MPDSKPVRSRHPFIKRELRIMTSLRKRLADSEFFNALNRTWTSQRIWLPLALVALAAVARIAPHPVNFTPIGAMALFAAATLRSRALAVALPLAAYWLSDLFLNNVVYSVWYDGFVWFTPGFLWMYGAMVLTSAIGWIALRKPGLKRIVGASLSTSMLFFLISNFGVWAGGTLYPPTPGGLLASYVAAIPFFGNAAAGDLFYSGALFGTFALLSRQPLPAWIRVRNRS